MAKQKENPTIDLEEGVRALDEDIPRVLKLLEVASLEDLGWSRANKICLLVPMVGVHQDREDKYLLRLGFQAYRKWPPSAQFVNPETSTYVYPRDQHFVPMLTSPECHTHVAYNRNPQTQMQLICCSATLEFYEVQHNVDQQHLWRETDTFFTTIVAVRKAFASFYQGRFPVYGQ